jgi:hypothetical protein
MVTIKITKLSDNTIRIERISGNATPAVQDYAAQFYATGDEGLNLITINTSKRPFTAISLAYDEIEINGTVPASVEEAVISLNEFIGNFNTGLELDTF